MTDMMSGKYLADLAFSPAYNSDRTIYALDREGHVFAAVNTLVGWKSYHVSADYIDSCEFNTLVVLPGDKILAGASDGIYEVINYISPAQRTPGLLCNWKKFVHYWAKRLAHGYCTIP
ncbi:MAG: hypothetical protein RQM92_16620 [Candidatus Syntrophopropionicum ammoniitolerans]